MKSQNQESLLDMVQGGVKERIGIEFNRVMDNILDPNAPKNKKRTITLKIELTPDNDAQMIAVNYIADSKLCPLNPIGTVLCVGADPVTGELGAAEMVRQVPGQKNLMDDTEAPEGKTIHFTPASQAKAALAK